MRTRQIAPLIALVTLLMGCSAPPASLQVSITTPSAEAFTSATQTVIVTVSGGTAQNVVLLKDGAPLATLSAPYTYVWDTTSETEGTYELVARANDGTTNVDSAPRKVTVDHTTPRLSSQTPVPNADNVAVKSHIQVVFSEPIQASSLTDTSVVLEGAGAVNIAKTLSLGADGRTLSVQPVKAVAAPDMLSLRLTAGVKDRAGNPLNAVSWSWKLPSWLRLGDDAVTTITRKYNPFLSSLSFHDLDGAGNPVIATNQDANPQGVLRHWDGQSWRPIPGPAEITPGGGSLVTGLVVDSGGNPVVTWQGKDANSANYDNLYVSRWDGSAWKMLGGALDVTPTLFPVASAIVLDSSDHPVVAWSESNSTGSTTLNNQYVKRWDGSNWIQFGGQLEGGDEHNVNRVALVLDASDNPVVESVGSFSESNLTYYRRWKATTASWEQLLGFPTYVTDLPAVAVRPNGELLTAYIKGEQGLLQTYYLGRWTGTAWESPYRSVLVKPNCFSIGPRLALDTGGNPVMAWVECYGQNNPTLYVARPTAQGWLYLGDPITVGVGSNETVESVSFKLDKNDIPTLSYISYERSAVLDNVVHKTRFRRLNQ